MPAVEDRDPRQYGRDPWDDSTLMSPAQAYEANPRNTQPAPSGTRFNRDAQAWTTPARIISDLPVQAARSWWEMSWPAHLNTSALTTGAGVDVTDGDNQLRQAKSNMHILEVALTPQGHRTAALRVEDKVIDITKMNRRVGTV